MLPLPLRGQHPSPFQVRLGNPRIKAAIIDTPAALEAMLAMGWQQAQEGEESVLLLSKSLSMAVVRGEALGIEGCLYGSCV